MEKKYVKKVGIVPTGKKSGVCGDWIELDKIAPDDQNIFDYLKGIPTLINKLFMKLKLWWRMMHHDLLKQFIHTFTIG